MRYQYTRRDGRVVQLREDRHLPSALAPTLHRQRVNPPAPSALPRAVPMPAIPALPPETLEISAWW